MVRAKETPVEKAARLSKQGAVLQTSIDFAQAVSVMKNRPEVIASVKHHLESRGWWSLTSEPSSLKKQGKTEPAPIAAPSANTPFGMACAEMPALLTCGLDVQVELHRNYKHWKDTPPKYLREILHMVEPISLNSKMLFGLCIKGQREVPKPPMLDLLERMTDMDPTNMELGDDRQIWKLALLAHRCNVANGRPCREISLPANWDKDGPYQLVDLGERGVCIKKRCSSADAWPHPALDGMRFGDLHIQAGHSQQRATLRSTSDPMFLMPCNILAMYAETMAKASTKRSGGNICTMAPPKKVRSAKLALENGGLAIEDACPAIDDTELMSAYDAALGVRTPSPEAGVSEGDESAGAPRAVIAGRARAACSTDPLAQVPGEKKDDDDAREAGGAPELDELSFAPAAP
mmetsp:Transcript_11109/g.22531  ORF Transcript_11109/g.22531 Transcript_11109/m.22531 type:complete len:405 (+) Transcript_11109:54-1268(+)